MPILDATFRLDVLVGSIVAPPTLLAAYLYWTTSYYLVAFLVFAFIGLLQELYLHHKASPRSSTSPHAHAGTGVMRISRTLYNQVDNDLLQLLASSRDFDDNDVERLLQLDACCFGGATESQINRLPLVPVTAQMLKASNCATCAICLGDVTLGTHVRLLQCFHHFHAACIDPWLERRPACPMCKFPAIG